MAHPSVYERQSAHSFQQSLQMPETYAPISTVQGMSTRDKKPRLSRLELMKQNYEKKRQKDVQEKLTEIRAQRARADSGKDHSGGTVRAFFAERRAMEASKRGQQDPSSLPPIGTHFKKMKSNNQGPVVPRSSQKKENKPVIPAENVTAIHGVHSTGNRGMVKYYRKKSKGVDKQNPLPPLQRRPSNPSNHKPPTPNRRYETQNTLKSEDEAFILNHSNVEQENIVADKDMVYVPCPPKNPKPSKTNARAAKPVLVDDNEERADEEDNDGWSLYSDEPQPNLSKVKALRMKRLSQKKLSIGNSKPEKPTEFQKWQMQQDEERRERLENHRKQNQHIDDSDNEQKATLSMREKELLEKIKAEQDKLSHIKRMQQELEEQEKLERENTITPQIPNENKRKMEVEEDESFQYAQKQIDKTPTPVKKVSPVIPAQEETQLQFPEAPKKSKPKPKPQIIQQEQDSDEHELEPKDNFVHFYEQAGEEAEQVEVDLTPCSICGRNFATERLSKHQVVCRKNSNKMRKKFDTRKQRVAGMEHENYVLSGKYKEETPKAKKADWRVQHENFVKTIRYAKGASSEPPPVIENPHYVACPYCERKFNPETAERHIPRCKDIKARPAPPPKKDRHRKKR